MSTQRSSTRRRASDVATDVATLFKSIFARFRRSDDTKRSLSTGDLADQPAPEESDYFEMDFTPIATTSTPAPLDPNFDDCDRVPMKFSSKGVRLIPQFRKSARRLMRFGSVEDLKNFSDTDVLLSEPWFYPDIDSFAAEKIIREAGCENGLFLVHYLHGVFQLVLCHNGKVHHRRIFKDLDSTKWRLGLEKAYRNIEELVQHYQSHKGYVLPTRLKNGCNHPLRYGTHGASATISTTHRTRA